MHSAGILAMDVKVMNTTTAKVGFWSAILTTLLTGSTFVIAFLTPPLSGPYCLASCFEYPFTDIAARFPRDYLWMYPAMILLFYYFILMSSIYHFVIKEKRIFAHIGLSFALISTAVLLMDYFLQVSVIQPSLMQGETDAIALFSQYNAHGIFIALEEIGYMVMSLSFLFLAPIFLKGSTKEKILGKLFVGNFLLAVLSLIFYSLMYGIYREYRFEIAIITINWLTLLISGVLLSQIFRKQQRIGGEER